MLALPKTARPVAIGTATATYSTERLAPAAALVALILGPVHGVPITLLIDGMSGFEPVAHAAARTGIGCDLPSRWWAS